MTRHDIQTCSATFHSPSPPEINAHSIAHHAARPVSSGPAHDKQASEQRASARAKRTGSTLAHRARAPARPGNAQSIRDLRPRVRDAEGPQSRRLRHDEVNFRRSFFSCCGLVPFLRVTVWDRSDDARIMTSSHVTSARHQWRKCKARRGKAGRTRGVLLDGAPMF